MVDAAGAWYDKIVASNGKYRVGHSALCLVNSLDNNVGIEMGEVSFFSDKIPMKGKIREVLNDEDLLTVP